MYEHAIPKAIAVPTKSPQTRLISYSLQIVLYLYLACFLTGRAAAIDDLTLLTPREPAIERVQPYLAAQLGGDIRAVDCQGGFYYVSQGTHLAIFDRVPLPGVTPIHRIGLGMDPGWLEVTDDCIVGGRYGIDGELQGERAGDADPLFAMDTHPIDVCADAEGNVYFCDPENANIRTIAAHPVTREEIEVFDETAVEYWATVSP